MSSEPRLLPGYAITEIKPPESPIEQQMQDLLEGGLDLGVRASFCALDTWQDVQTALREYPETFSRPRMVVFPQVTVGRFRADFLVAVADRLMDTIDAVDGFEQVFVECDGREFHSVESGSLWADRDREHFIKRHTGLDILRFSGAELTYRREQVVEVMSAYLEARFAVRRLARMRMEHLLRVHDYARDEVQDMMPEPPPEIGKVIALSRDLAALPAGRYEYQSASADRYFKALRAAVAAMRDRLEEWHPSCLLCDDL